MHPVRVLVAKVGMDRADRGATVVTRVLRDAGHEVMFHHVGVTPAMVAEIAARDRVEVVVLTMPNELADRLAVMVRHELDQRGATGCRVVVAGIALPHMVRPLRSVGVSAVVAAAASAAEMRAAIADAVAEMPAAAA